MTDGCGKTPGVRFATRELAEGEILTRRLNVVGNGGSAAPTGDYEVKGCDCGSFHVMTKAQLERRKRRRRNQG